jgi:2-dehydro-3-deoxyphosphooctonate aldolase (KDO 8-P synthase)
MKKRVIQIANFAVGQGHPLTVISGPCVIETEEQSLQVAARLKKMAEELGFQLIFKSSFDKANRSSKSTFRGPGLEKGLRILEKVKRETGLAVLTDVHESDQAKAVAEVCDVLQIPAFLCRQTDLLIACAKTMKPIHVKKGQFMAPWDMGNVVEKLEGENNFNIILGDRGVSFGYNNLVSDMRAIPIMQRFGYPVCYDASHSVQLPGGDKLSSGGDREMIPFLAKAAIAAGADVLFIETHPTPELAKSDSKTVYPLDQLATLLKTLQAIYELVQR